MADDASLGTQGQPRSAHLGGRLQNLRNLLRSERHSSTHPRALEVLDRELEEMSGRDLPPVTDRPRGEVDVLEHNEEAGSGSEPRPIRRSSSEFVRSRRRLYRRPSARLRDHNLPTDNYDRLDSLTLSPLSPSLTNLDGQDPASDNESRADDRSRAKRRKLGDGTYDDGSSTFSYGYKGQAVPGKLRLEIVPCDNDDPEEGDAASYPIRNILAEDDCNYLSRSSKLNVMMKHVGGQPFTLESIVVKAPWHEYDWPPMGGLVFIAMEEDGLVENSSRFDPQYPPRRHRYHSHRREWYRTSRDYSAQAPIGDLDRSRYLRNPYSPQVRHIDHEVSQDTPLVPGFQVTVEEDHIEVASPAHSSWRRSLSPTRQYVDDTAYSWRPYADRYRPFYMPETQNPESATSDDSDGESGPPQPIEPDPNQDSQSYRQRRLLNVLRLRQRLQQRPDMDRPTLDRMNEISTDMARNEATPPIQTRHREPVEASSSKTIRTSTAPTFVPTPENLVPHAKFSLHQGRRSAKITFDPPVAGRYLLLKVWSACPSASIDIQQFTAYGYGGPRFFPAIEMR